MSTTQIVVAQKKATEETGISDAVSDQMFHLKEGHWIAIVDLAHFDRTEGPESKQIARLKITQLEVLTGPAADHARELMRAVYLHRQPKGLEGTEGEPVDRIIELGKNTILSSDVTDPWEYETPEGTVKATVDV